MFSLDKTEVPPGEAPPTEETTVENTDSATPIEPTKEAESTGSSAVHGIRERMRMYVS